MIHRLKNAIHEAGHACAVHECGGRIASVCVAADGQSGLCTAYVPAAMPAMLRLLILDVGDVAAHLFTPLSAERAAPPRPSAPAPPGDTSDRKAAAIIRGEPEPGDDVTDGERVGIRLAADYLQSPARQRAIEGLGEMLARRLTIDGDDVHAVLDGYGIPRTLTTEPKDTPDDDQ